MKLLPYLKMHGNARGALQRYQSIFNGTITRLSQYKDSPLSSPQNKTLIIHCELHFQGNTICLADMITKQQSQEIVRREQLYQLCLNFQERELDNAKRVYQELGKGGQVVMQFQETFWDAYYGKVKDQFGVVWSINCEKSPIGVLKNQKTTQERLQSNSKSHKYQASHRQEHNQEHKSEHKSILKNPSQKKQTQQNI